MTAPEKMIRVLLVAHQQPSTMDLLIESIPLLTVSRCDSLAQATARITTDEAFDVVMIDLQLAKSDPSILQKLHGSRGPTPIIVLTDRSDEDSALSLLRQGAHDYLIHEDLDLDATTRALRYAIHVSRLQRRVQDLDRNLEVANHRLRELFLPTSERILEGPVGRRRVRTGAETQFTSI